MLVKARTLLQRDDDFYLTVIILFSGLELVQSEWILLLRQLVCDSVKVDIQSSPLEESPRACAALDSIKLGLGQQIVQTIYASGFEEYKR